MRNTSGIRRAILSLLVGSCAVALACSGETETHSSHDAVPTGDEQLGTSNDLADDQAPDLDTIADTAGDPETSDEDAADAAEDPDIGHEVDDVDAVDAAGDPEASDEDAGDAAEDTDNPPIWRPLVYDDGVPLTDFNPLKGFVGSPAWGLDTDFPHSMEFHYFPVRAVMTASNTFDWATLDALLDATAGRGNQSVIRPYLDYPNKETGVPQFLIDGGLEFDTYTDHGGGRSPDYDDADLLQAINDFVTAFGARYDGDPRLAFVQLGIFGFWGEWHTYPYESWEMSDENRVALLATYLSAFTTTKLQLRRPGNGEASQRTKLGYHDDSFCHSTIDITDTEDWFFLTLLTSAGLENQWQHNVIGGELRPGLQSTIFGPDYTVSKFQQDWDSTVSAVHPTYMINSYAFTGRGYAETQMDAALTAHRQLGYELHISEVRFSSVDDTVVTDVRLQNRGLAPFYYDWQVELAALHTGTEALTSLGTGSAQLPLVQPDDTDHERTLTGTAALPAGDYKLLLRVVNPLSASASNARVLRFANAEQDADLEGWLTLGTFAR